MIVALVLFFLIIATIRFFAILLNSIVRTILVIISFFLTLLGAFKGGGSIKIRSLTATVLLVYHSSTHFTRSLAFFLCKDYIQGSSLDNETIHFITGFLSLFRSSVFDKGKSLGLLGMIIPWNVDISNLSNTSKGLV